MLFNLPFSLLPDTFVFLFSCMQLKISKKIQVRVVLFFSSNLDVVRSTE
jgi:hypothetical protein